MQLRDACIKATIEQFEGGFVNHPADPGGATKYGITKRMYEKFKGRAVTVKEVADMPIEDAIECYKKLVWGPSQVENIPEPLQHLYFDITVNSGEDDAAKIFQRALNDLGYVVKVDAVFGPVSQRILDKAYKEQKYKAVNDAIVARRVRFFESLAANNNSLRVFLKGWKKRAVWFQTHSVYAQVKG